MSLFHRFNINLSHSLKYHNSLQTLLLPLTLRRLPKSLYLPEKRFGSSGAKFEKVPSLFKYELFSESTAPIVLDVEKERQKIVTEEVLDEFQGIGLKRGSTGVIDVEEAVELLRKEKGQDIFVVKIPPEYNYADYKVIVTGISQRHMLAMANLMRRLYKKRVSSGQLPHLEGAKSKVWIALDLGNIILHVFSSSGRHLYDLETLWTVGKEYDGITHSKNTSCYDITDYSNILASLTPSP